jgi:seryl-tRNA synthetase
MTAAANRTDLNPFEEIIIARTLETSTGQESLMNEINRLTEERNRLQSELARHPWSNREAAQRVREITAELDTLWTQLRRIRAARRVRMEEALGVHPVDESPRSAGKDEEAA